MTGGAPTFFVILKQPGNGKTDQGILVTNRDARALLSRESSPGKSKEKICLPADCTVGKITVTLDNNSMWNEFHNRSTEMILTKQGRRMFPYCRYWITGLDSNLKYILVMDISPVDSHRYKWNGRWWEPSGKAEPHILGRVSFIQNLLLQVIIGCINQCLSINSNLLTIHWTRKDILSCTLCIVICQGFIWCQQKRLQK